MLFRAAEERDAEAEAARRRAATEEVEHECLLMQDSRRVSYAHFKEEEEDAADIARQLEEDRKNAEAAQDEAFARLLKGNRSRALEAHHRAMEQEEV